MLWYRLSAIAVLWVAVSEGGDTCPAGAGQGCNAVSRGGAPVQSENRTLKVRKHATADLITQEVEELRAFMQLCKKRITLLEGLQRAVTSQKNLSIPETYVRALQEPMPLMSDVTIDEDTAPHSSADDFLVSKAIIPLEDPVSFIKILPLRNPHGSGPTSTAQTAMPTALLVAVRTDGAIRLFSPSGEMYLSFSAGHEQPVSNLAVSPSHDEYFLTTVDIAGVMRVHKVNVRQRWLTREQKQGRRNSFDEKTSQYLGSQVNVTAQFTKQIKLRRNYSRPTKRKGSQPEPPPSDIDLPMVTALAVASQQGTKYFIVGDDEGQITIFTRNGTFAAKLNVSVSHGEQVDALYCHLSNVIFRVGYRWGFINLDKMEVQYVHCPKFPGRVSAAVIDSQHSTKVLVSDDEGTVWVLNVKDRKHCKVEHRFARGTTVAPLELSSVRGYAIALERTANEVVLSALNMSHVGKKRKDVLDDDKMPSGAVVWRKGRQPLRDWAVYKRYQQGDLLAFLSEDGYEIEVVELLMQTYQAPSGAESFNNYQAPVIAVGIVLVLGFQWAKSQGMFGGDDDRKEMERQFGSLRKGKKGKKKKQSSGGLDGFDGGGFGGGAF